MGLVPARRPGWLLEGRGDPSPRGMAAQSPLDCGDGQNPAYRPSGVYLYVIASVAKQSSFALVDCFVAALLAMTDTEGLDGETETI
jgi:hypothetical protein